MGSVSPRPPCRSPHFWWCLHCHSFCSARRRHLRKVAASTAVLGWHWHHSGPFYFLVNSVLYPLSHLLQIIPTPLVMFSTFVGFLGGGILGAILMTVGMFLPAFSFTLIGHKFFERIVDIRAIRHFLDGITAAVMGMIAITAFQVPPTSEKSILISSIDYRECGHQPSDCGPIWPGACLPLRFQVSLDLSSCDCLRGTRWAGPFSECMKNFRDSVQDRIKMPHTLYLTCARIIYSGDAVMLASRLEKG